MEVDWPQDDGTIHYSTRQKKKRTVVAVAAVIAAATVAVALAAAAAVVAVALAVDAVDAAAGDGDIHTCLGVGEEEEDLAVNFYFLPRRS